MSIVTTEEQAREKIVEVMLSTESRISPIKLSAGELLEVRINEVQTQRITQTDTSLSEAATKIASRLQSEYFTLAPEHNLAQLSHALDEIEKFKDLLYNKEDSIAKAIAFETSYLMLKMGTSTLAKGSLESITKASLAQITTRPATIFKHLVCSILYDGVTGEILTSIEIDKKTLEDLKKQALHISEHSSHSKIFDIDVDASKKAVEKIQGILPELDIAIKNLGNIAPHKLLKYTNSAIAEKFEKSLGTLEHQYRSSPEARVLRLLRDISGKNLSDVINDQALHRGITQLQKTGVEECKKTLAELEERLDLSNSDRDLFLRVIQTPLPQQKQEEAIPSVSTEPPELVNEQTTLETESIKTLTDEDKVFYRELLNELGISDNAVTEKLLDHCSATELQELERWISVLPNGVINAILSVNPAALDPEFSASSYLRKLDETIASTSDLVLYEVFDPLKFPEFFSTYKALSRTNQAAELVRKVRQEVTTEHFQSQSQVNSEPKNPPVERAHPEQHLINQLAEHVTYPYVAYGLIRDGLCYQGSYKTSGVPEGFRRRLLKATFTKEPDASVMEETERELIQLGLLIRHTRSARGTDNLISLAPIRDIHPSLKNLYVALTNVETRPTTSDKLEPK